ncbi:MAG: hypothetical protein PHW73_14525, partial [Atribacterota bacterium]|nr:hypothetical protein [Atribacterota bacterium]
DLLFSWVILNFTSLMVLVYFIMEVLDGPFQVILIYFYRKYSTDSYLPVYIFINHYTFWFFIRKTKKQLTK